MNIKTFKVVSDDKSLIDFIKQNGRYISETDYEAIIWDTDERIPEQDNINVYIVKNGIQTPSRLTFNTYDDILKILDVEVFVCKNYLLKST